MFLHPDAVIAEDVLVGAGTVVMAGTVINSRTVIGKGCIINTSSRLQDWRICACCSRSTCCWDSKDWQWNMSRHIENFEKGRIKKA